MSSESEDRTEYAEDRTELAEERTEWAEERTEWADQRTYLAQERTFAGWVSTGLTSIAVGLGVIELLREVEPQWVITTLGVIFITVGGLLNILAFFSHRKVTLNLKESHRPEMTTSAWWVGVITAALVVSAVGALILVFA